MNLYHCLKTLPLEKAFPLYSQRCCKLKRETFQYQDWYFAWNQVQCCIVRSRGGSKTKDFVDWICLRVLRSSETWVWLSAKSGQLNQARVYFRLNGVVSTIKFVTQTRYEVVLVDGQVITVGIITEDILGRRVDGIIFDEEESMEPKQTQDAYGMMPGMLTASPVHKIIHIGTLWIRSKFNDNCNDYPTSKRDWTQCPWLVKAGMIQAEIDAGVTPEWQIDLSYRCIPSMPSGVMFSRVVLEAFPEWLKTQRVLYGMDFGSHDVCVGSVIVGDCCYIVEEYSRELEHNNMGYNFLAGKDVEAESGGYNDMDKYAAKSRMMQREIRATLRAVTNAWKSERQMRARTFAKIVLNPNLTPNTYSDIKAATFGPDGLYLKDVAHPCHYLDAWLHSLHTQSQEMDIPDTNILDHDPLCPICNSL